MIEEEKMEDASKEEVIKRDQPKKETAKEGRSMPVLTAVLITIGVALVIGAVACAGRVLTSRRAEGRRVYANANMMAGPISRGSRMMGGRGGNFSRGSFLGKVTKIIGNTLTINANNQDIEVSIASTTSIYKSPNIAKQSDIAIGSEIAVRGSAGSDGIVQAQSIVIINQ